MPECGYTPELQDRVNIQWTVQIFDESLTNEVVDQGKTNKFELFEKNPQGFIFDSSNAYQISWNGKNDFKLNYKDDTDEYVKFIDLKGPSNRTQSNNLTTYNTLIEDDPPDRCHYNYHREAHSCLKQINNSFEIVLWQDGGNSSLRTNFTEPDYIKWTKIFTFADRNGHDYLLLHHALHWVYLINVEDAIRTKQIFHKVYHMLKSSEWQFVDFINADELGIVSLYQNVSNPRHFRYYYSIFDDVSGMETYCVHDGHLNGVIGIFGHRVTKDETKRAAAEALRDVLHLGKIEDPWKVLKYLFYSVSAYFILFCFYQMFEIEKPSLSLDLAITEREAHRLAPVVQPILEQVYHFLNSKNKK